MAIEPSIGPEVLNGILPTEEEGLAIEVDSHLATIIDTDDGGIMIDFNPDEMVEEEIPFDANLAEYCDDECLQHLSSELIGMCDSDKLSRKEWEDTYIKGLDQLGMKIEDRTTPWPGACGVQHPVLAEAVVRFQAQTITEIFPNSGPVKTDIVGKITEEKEKLSLIHI